MKKIAVVLLFSCLWVVVAQAQVDKNKEKVKEVESKSFDFRIDKVVAFFNIVDADLHIPAKGKVLVKNSKGEIVHNIDAQGVTEIRLPIQDVYQVEITQDGFASEFISMDLRKVNAYEFSKDVHLKPKKS